MASAALAAGGAATASASARSHWHQGGGRRLAAPAPREVTPAAARGGQEAVFLYWSGYAQATSSRGTFTAARDFWTVPAVKTGSGNQYSADWVGIDGFSNAKLVQDGTEADNVGGMAVYCVWTEILPASEVVISGLAIPSR